MKNMEKISKSIYKNLPAVKIHLDDIIDIFNFFKKYSKGELKMVVDNFRLYNLNELKEIKKNRVDFFGSVSSDPHISLEFRKDGGRIYSSDDNVMNKGIILELEELLNKHKRKCSHNIPYWIELINSVLIGILVGGLLLLRYPQIFILGIPSIILFLMSFNNTKSIIKLKKRNEVSSFWSRKKDEIWLIVISNFIGIFLGIVGTLIAQYLIKK